MKKLKSILAIVGMIAIAIKTYDMFLPVFVDLRGPVTVGSYRGIEIGWDKYSAAMALTTGGWDRGRPTVYGFVDHDHPNHFQFLFDSPQSILEEDVWLATYPGIMNEIITLYFEDDVLARIEVAYSPLDP